MLVIDECNMMRNFLGLNSVCSNKDVLYLLSITIKLKCLGFGEALPGTA